MKALLSFAISAISIGLGCIPALAQNDAPSAPPVQAASAPPQHALNTGPVDINWTPAALNRLSAEATSRSSFALDRNTLSLAAGLVPDSEPETRQAISKIDGVSVHMLRFGPAGIPDESAVSEIRNAYHLRGWKHLVTNAAVLPTGADRRDPLHNGTTDLWLVMDGVNVRGAVVLVEKSRSLTLIAMAGNISPVDMLHLRGHFGIPPFDGDEFRDAGNR